MALPAEKDRYTFADVLEWDDGERAELIDGEIFLMAPAPSRVHQGISVELTRQFANYLEGKKCKAYHAMSFSYCGKKAVRESKSGSRAASLLLKVCNRGGICH